METISILGATGSIGLNTLDVIQRNRGAFRVQAITAHKNVIELARIARETNAQFAVIADPDRGAALKEALADTPTQTAAGKEALIEAACHPSDIVMAAISGIAGLPAVEAAARRRVKLALANKESIVCAGPLLKAAAKQSGCQIVPVDSEHHALGKLIGDQVFGDSGDVMRATLTATGGPLRDCPLEHLADVTPAEAIRHPVWDMGAKISVDSATLMNKTLELIEAHYLFDLPPERLAMVVHPEAIVHALVASYDGCVRAHMGVADMRLAIADVLGVIDSGVKPLDITQLGALTFLPVDEARFPASKLAVLALKYGGAAPIILNAANEVAVASFLSERIGFTDIAVIVRDVLEQMMCARHNAPGSLADIIGVDEMTRCRVGEIIKRNKTNV